MNVLLLAGSTEARRLAGLLVDEPGVDVVASLAGRTGDPVALPCPVRTGGFGGVDGLVAHLRAGRVRALVDATHPCAPTMPRHAAAAAARAGVPRLRVLRPPWRREPGDDWVEVDDLEAAASALRRLGARRALLTVGRLQLAPFAALPDVAYVVRSVDPPSLPGATTVTARGPFTVDDEGRLLREHGVDALVTRDSGGDRAKLDAARAAGVRVVVVRRPPAPPGPCVETPADGLAWVRGLR